MFTISDQVISKAEGLGEVIRVYDGHTYPVRVRFNNETVESYTLEGLYFKDEVTPDKDIKHTGVKK